MLNLFIRFPNTFLRNSSSGCTETSTHVFLIEHLSGSYEEISFSKQILPLLSNNCFECHGPDKAERKAGLRLDTHEGAKMELKSGFSALVPGESSESEMYMRIISDDPEEIMPPPESSKSLTEDQKELIKKEILIEVFLDRGLVTGRFFTCDLTHDYISINTDYRT